MFEDDWEGDDYEQWLATAGPVDQAYVLADELTEEWLASVRDHRQLGA